jgi:hypothetical protein
MAAGYPVPHEYDHAMRSQAKPYQKPHQKQGQFPKSHQKDKKWVQDELPFNDKPWREPVLTDTEIEELFWGKLVQLGWRIETYGDVTPRKNLVLPCPYCNHKLETIVWEFINPTNVKKMSDGEDVRRRIENHGGSICQALPEA